MYNMYAPLGENGVFACLGVVESCDIIILLLIIFGHSIIIL